MLSAVSRCYHLHDTTTAIARYWWYPWHEPSPASASEAAAQLSVPYPHLLGTDQHWDMPTDWDGWLDELLTATSAHTLSCHVSISNWPAFPRSVGGRVPLPSRLTDWWVMGGLHGVDDITNGNRLVTDFH